MDYVSSMKRCKSLDRLVQNERAHPLRYITLSLLNNGREASTVHILEEYPKSAPEIERIVASDDIIIVLAHLHDAELILNNLLLLLVLGLDEFQSVLLPIHLVFDQEDTGKTSIANFLDDFVVL